MLLLGSAGWGGGVEGLRGRGRGVVPWSEDRCLSVYGLSKLN